MNEVPNDIGDDPVAEEIYRAKDEYARSLGYDLNRIVADLRGRVECRSLAVPGDLTVPRPTLPRRPAVRVGGGAATA